MAAPVIPPQPELPPVNNEPPGDPERTRGPDPETASVSFDLAQRQMAVARAPERLMAPARAVPATAQRALDWLREHLGMGEDPPGSNCNEITRRFGLGCVAWCAETASYAINYAFGDVDTWAIDIAADYPNGTAFVPNLRLYFMAAGRYFSTPRIGAAAVCVWGPGTPIGDHVGLIESWVDLAGDQRTDEFVASQSDGTVVMLDGNYGNDLIRIRRSMSFIDGYGLPPYDDTEDDDMFTDADREALAHVSKVTEHLERWGDLSDQGGNPGGTAHEAVMARLGAIEDRVKAIEAKIGGGPAGVVEVKGTLNLSPRQ